MADTFSTLDGRGRAVRAVSADGVLMTYGRNTGLSNRVSLKSASYVVRVTAYRRKSTVQRRAISTP